MGSQRGVGEERAIDNPEGRVTALSIEYLAENPVLVVAAGYDGTIVLRGFWSGEQVGPAYTGCGYVDSVTVGLVGGRRVVVAHGNSQCWMWDQQSGTLLDDVPAVEAGWSVAGLLSIDGRVALSLFRIDCPDDPQMVGFHTSLVEAGTAAPVWPVCWRRYVPTLMATSVLARGPVSVAILAVGEGFTSLQAWSPATTDQRQVVGEGLVRVQELRVRTLSVGEIDGRVVAAYAPDFDGSSFVRLVELEPDPGSFFENYVLPPYDPRAVYLSQFEIWSALKSGSDGVQVLGVEVLQSRSRRLKLVEFKSGFDWGKPVDAPLTPEVVSQALGRKISAAQPVSPFFSMREDEAIPVLLDTVENATRQASRRLRLRRKDPGGWPATTMSHGFLDGRAVLVCGSYRGAIWIWDLETKELLAGPFANIPDDFEFDRHAKMAPFKNAVTDVAIGDLDGDAVVAAAVAGKVTVYDVKSGAALPEPAISSSIVVAVALGNFEGRSVVVTGSRGGVLAVWDARTATRITGVTLDSKIDEVWMVHGADAIAARSGNSLLIFDLVQNSKTEIEGSP